MAEKYTIGTPSESERLVRDWGFKHVFTWSDGRYATTYPIHKFPFHLLRTTAAHTTHHIHTAVSQPTSSDVVQ